MRLDPLLGQPFGSCYEVNQDGALYPAVRDPVGEWHAAKPEDDHRSNKAIFDRKDASAQGLSHDDIARLKREGVGGDALVARLCENSATFSEKTAFAQEKYVKKKMLKHVTRVRARRPTARAVCEAYFYKQPAATNWMRHDALGMLLLLGNVGVNARPLVVETCGGLIVSAVAERVGFEGTSGRVCASHAGKQCPSLDISKLMNLSPAARDCVVTAPLTDLLDARARWLKGEDVDATAHASEVRIAAERTLRYEETRRAMDAEGRAERDSERKERPKGWSPKRFRNASPAVLGDLARPSEGFSSLIIAAPGLEPLAALVKVTPLLAPSAPFAVWCPFAQPLAEALAAMREAKTAVNLALHEPWLRRHQVLPGRTHPTMTTGAGAGGYVLSGNWIPPERLPGTEGETVEKKRPTESDGGGGGDGSGSDVDGSGAHKKSKP